MARPKIKKNRYVVELTPISNFRVVYYDDDENPEEVSVAAEWTRVMQDILRHNKRTTGSPEFILPF